MATFAMGNIMIESVVNTGTFEQGLQYYPIDALNDAKFGCAVSVF